VPFGAGGVSLRGLIFTDFSVAGLHCPMLLWSTHARTLKVHELSAVLLPSKSHVGSQSVQVTWFSEDWLQPWTSNSR
jgi:hypothetical protein